MKYLIFLIFLNVQSNELSKVDFVNICKELAEEKELNAYLFNYKFKKSPSLFVKGIPSILKGHDERISFNTSKGEVFIWFEKHLFDENVLYWLEFTEFVVDKNQIKVEYRTFNSIDSKNKLPVVKGSAIFSKNADSMLIKKSTFKLLKV